MYTKHSQIFLRPSSTVSIVGNSEYLTHLYKTGNSLSLNIYRVFFHSETVTQRRIQRCHAEKVSWKDLFHADCSMCKTQGMFVQRESANYTGAIIVRKYNWSIIVSLDDRGKHPRSLIPDGMAITLPRRDIA